MEDNPKPKQHRVPLEGNAFRYQDYEEGENSQKNENGEELDLNWDHLAIGDQYKYIPRTIQSQEPYLHDEEQNHENDGVAQPSKFAPALNIHKLSACLENMETSRWMRLSDDMTKKYDDRIAKKEKTGEIKMTVAEMAMNPTLVIVNETAPVTIRDTEEIGMKQNENMNVPMQVAGVEESSEDDSGNSEDEDLDAWLDGVIET